MVGVLAGLRQELRALAVADETLSVELAGSSGLFGAYNPRLRDLHDAHAEALERIIERIGWPTQELVGLDGADAAWRIVQRAIARPTFQRRCLALLQEAAEQGLVPPWQPAALLDRIRVLEGRQQVYGTQFDWNPDGGISPCPIEDPEGVDRRRAAVELEPLMVALDAERSLVRERGDQPPEDWAERERAMARFAQEVGWR